MPDRRKYERTPDTVALLVAQVAAAGIMTVTRQAPGSVESVAPGWEAAAWAAAFGAAAVLTLFGVLWREPITGWLLELVGRLGLAAAMAGYAVALIDAARTWGASLAILIMSAIVAASVVRVVQLAKRLRGFWVALRRGPKT